MSPGGGLPAGGKECLQVIDQGLRGVHLTYFRLPGQQLRWLNQGRQRFAPLAAAVAGLLVNARHFPFGIAVRDLVGSRLSAMLGCHIMNDESVVFGLSQPTPQQRKAAIWLCGIVVAVVWPLGAVLGSVMGKLLPDTEVIGLDAVFPAILLALVIPALKSRTTLTRASCGAAVSLLAVPFTPIGLPVLLSMLGLLARKK